MNSQIQNEVRSVDMLFCTLSSTCNQQQRESWRTVRNTHQNLHVQEAFGMLSQKRLSFGTWGQNQVYISDTPRMAFGGR